MSKWHYAKRHQIPGGRGVEADILLVAAQLPDHAIGVFAVETNTPGITLLPKSGMGLKSAGLTEVLLEDVLVDDSVLLRVNNFPGNKPRASVP